MGLTRQFARFALIGAVGFVIDVGLLYALAGAGLGLYLARAISLLAAASFTWLGNRRYTFSARVLRGRHRGGEWALYVGAMLAGGAVNYGLYAGLITWLDAFRAAPVLAVAVSTVFSMLVNFLSARRILHRSTGAPPS